jgi:hypothetical protein
VKISHPAGPLSIFTTQTFDLQAHRGAYFGDAGLQYETHIRKAAFEISVSAGGASAPFNRAYIGPSRSAFNLLSAEASLTYPLSPHISLRPHFETSRIMDHQLRRALTEPTQSSTGLAVDFKF